MRGDWLDGGLVVAWLEQRYGVVRRGEPTWTRHLAASDVRRVWDWKHGTYRCASVYTVDRILTRLDRHLSELPESFYVAPPPRTRVEGRATC